jgi:integrase
MEASMGQVFQRTYRAKDGSVRTCETWTIRYYRNGRPHQEPTKHTRKTDAEKLLKTREGDIAKGLPVTAAMGRLSFDDAVKAVVEDYQINGRRSKEDVERRIKLHLSPAFGSRRMVEITTREIRAFTAQRLAAEASNAEVNRELAIVKRAFRIALKDGTLLHSPYVPMLQESNVRTGFFEPDEFQSVRDALPQHLQGVVTFAYLTGWRIASEVLPLQWARVNRNAHTVRLDPGSTKNGRGRTLDYSDNADLCNLIDQQWKEHERLAGKGKLCPFVFNRSGKELKNFRKAWSSACTKAGVPGKLLHDFRRTAVRNMVRAGVPEHSAMHVTGHLTRSVFDRYDVTNGADVRAAIGSVTVGVTVAPKGRVRRFARR